MAVNTTVQVTLPAMGESVREGTVLEWHKQEGDAVEADETIVDVSTDKVDAEVPSPVAGEIVEILVAGLISRRLFTQKLTLRDAAGMALVVVGIAILFNS